MLIVDDVRVSYGAVEALAGVGLTVSAREVVCVLGPNGAGKSTLVRTISGLHPLASGRILFEGQSLVGKDPSEIARMGVVHCPEGRQLLGSMTVEENLRLAVIALGRPWKGAQTQVDYVVGLFPLIRDRWKQAASTLSGGEQQMVAFARALVAKPKLLLLDEPALGLAPKIVRLVFDAIALCAADDIAVVLVEQNASAALRVAQRGYILRNGSVSFVGTGDALANELKSGIGLLGVVESQGI